VKVKNKYVICSRISEAKFRQIILLFSEDLSATQISHLTKLSRQTTCWAIFRRSCWFTNSL